MAWVNEADYDEWQQHKRRRKEQAPSVGASLSSAWTPPARPAPIPEIAPSGPLPGASTLTSAWTPPRPALPWDTPRAPDEMLGETSPRDMPQYWTPPNKPAEPPEAQPWWQDRAQALLAVPQLGPAELLDAGGRILREVNRPQQALIAGYDSPSDASLADILAATQRGWAGDTDRSFRDAIKSKGGLDNGLADRLIGPGSSDTLSDAVGSIADFIVDPLSTVGYAGKAVKLAGRGAGAVGQGINELATSPPVRQAAAKANELITSPALRRFVPGATVEAVEQAPEVASRRFYHGTGSAFDVPDAAKFDPNGLYGPGYYVTDAPEVAGSYAEKKAPKSADGKWVNVKNSDGGWSAVYEAERVGPNVRAINVPENLRLLDVDAPLDKETGNRLADAIESQYTVDNFPSGLKATEWLRDVAPKRGETVQQALFSMINWVRVSEETLPNGHTAYTPLSRKRWPEFLPAAGYDGIKYSGGQIMPLKDAAGQPIEHTALVIFPESLPKIQNAISGTYGGSAPEIGGAVVGGLAYQDDPSLSAAENLARRAAFAAGGAGLGNVGRRLGSKSGLGGTVEDVGETALLSPATGAAGEEARRFAKMTDAELAEYNARIANPAAQAVPPIPETGASRALAATTPESVPIQAAELPAERILNQELTTPEMVAGSQGRKSGGPPEPPINIDGIPILPPPSGKPPIEVSVSEPKSKAVFSQFWNRARNVIAAQGEPGKQLAGMLQETRDKAEMLAGRWVLNMPTVRRLSKEEFDNFVDVAERKSSPLNNRVQQAAEEWARARGEIHETAVAAGVDTGFIEDYFPHHYDPAVFKRGTTKWNQAVEHLMKTGQATDQRQAEMMLRYRNDVLRHRRVGNLELPRITDLPGYERTKDSLLNYVSQASNRIAQVAVLGDKDAKAMQLITEMGNLGYDADAAKNLFDISVGAKQYGEYQKKISQIGRAYSTFTKLGLGALTNAAQSVNTATVTGGLRTVLNTPRAIFSQEAKDFALKTGVTLDMVIRDLKEGGGFAGRVGDWGAPGFSKVEKFNRTLAAVAGRDYARDLARQATRGSKSARDGLQAMGLDPIGIVKRGGKLNELEEIKAARNIVERTQFKVDPQDLPGWMDSPLGKMVAQFRTFSYNQTAFIGREVLQPALRGNVKPLIRFLIYGGLVGTAEQEVQDFLRNRPREEDPLQYIRHSYERVGGLGVLGDLAQSLAPKNSKYLPAERYALGVASTIAGPTLGTAFEGMGAAAIATQGKPESLQRFILKQTPIVGQTLKNTLMPYKPGGRSGSAKGAAEKYMEKAALPKNVEKYLNRAVLPANVEKFLSGGR